MKNTAQDWDEVRKAFSASIMVDTALSSLAQNLDGPDWPMAEETPANYIDLSFDEMRDWLAVKGLTPDNGDLLIDILRDTLAFDSPFGEMVEQNEAAAVRDNQLLKNLGKLGIPHDFPIALLLVSPDTLEFCRAEGIETLAGLAVFAQSMSQAVIVGGDFRKLLNSLSHIDEASIAEFLPFRPGESGLHLVEALAQATQSENPAARAALAVNWFANEFAQLKAEAAVERGALTRRFAVLGSPELEFAAAELLRPHMKLAPANKSRGGTASGLLGSLGRLFGR
jgi:hypothetical protein